MPVYLYKDKNFQGPVVRLQPGFYSGRRLEGTVRNSSYGEDLNNEISSVRVDRGYVAVLYNSLSDTASSGARTLVGPTEVPDLDAIGINDSTSYVSVFMYDDSSPAIPRDFGVTLYSGVGRTGMQTHIGQGAFDRDRLDSDEVDVPRIQSLCVGKNTLVILYEGKNFESTLDSVAIAGEKCVNDVDSIGMYGDNMTEKIGSIRVLYSAAGFDTPDIATGLSREESAILSLKSNNFPKRKPGAHYVVPLLQAPAIDNYPEITLNTASNNSKQNGTQSQFSKKNVTILVLFILIILVSFSLLLSLKTLHKINLNSKARLND